MIIVGDNSGYSIKQNKYKEIHFKTRPPILENFSPLHEACADNTLHRKHHTLYSLKQYVALESKYKSPSSTRSSNDKSAFFIVPPPRGLWYNDVARFGWPEKLFNFILMGLRFRVVTVSPSLIRTRVSPNLPPYLPNVPTLRLHPTFPLASKISVPFSTRCIKHGLDLNLWMRRWDISQRIMLL